MADIGTLLPPPVPKGLPEDLHWLGGIGAGTWFHLSTEHVDVDGGCRIRRFSPEGVCECDRIFQTEEKFDVSKPFEFTYISTCKSCNIIQEDRTITFQYVRDFQA